METKAQRRPVAAQGHKEVGKLGIEFDWKSNQPTSGNCAHDSWLHKLGRRQSSAPSVQLRLSWSCLEPHSTETSRNDDAIFKSMGRWCFSGIWVAASHKGHACSFNLAFLLWHFRELPRMASGGETAATWDPCRPPCKGKDTAAHG